MLWLHVFKQNDNTKKSARVGGASHPSAIVFAAIIA